MSFETVSLTRVGGREVNEDYVDALHTPEASCWVIADGLGGHRGGAIASKLVVETALRSFQEQPQVAAEQVERHIEQAQEALLAAQRSDASLAQMRSTIVVLVANDRDAVWGHVGDTRLYHLRGGRIASRTRDHSVSQALVDGGQVDQRHQGAHEDRSRLLRSLGKEGEPCRPTIGGPHALCRDDAFLLCTDGFWEALDEAAVEIDYAGSEDATAWLDRLEARLRAQDTPLKDNHSATAIRLINADAPAPPPHDPRRLPAGARSSSGSIPVPGAVSLADATVATIGAAVPRVGTSGAAVPGTPAPPGAPSARFLRDGVGAGAPSARFLRDGVGAGVRAEPVGLFGAHRATLMRILYASMVIVLLALIYTAYVAYNAYAARGTHGARDHEPVHGETPNELKGSQPTSQPKSGPAEKPVTKPGEKSTGKPAASGPDAKSPDAKSPEPKSSGLGTAGSLSGSGDAASADTAAAAPPDKPHETSDKSQETPDKPHKTPDKPHDASPADVPKTKQGKP